VNLSNALISSMFFVIALPLGGFCQGLQYRCANFQVFVLCLLLFVFIIVIVAVLCIKLLHVSWQLQWTS